MRPKFPSKIMVAGEISRYEKNELYVVPMGETVNGNTIAKIFCQFTPKSSITSMFSHAQTCLSLCKMEQLVILLE